MSVFALNAVVAITTVSLYVIACGIQWRQYPTSEGYSTRYRVGMVIGQAAVITAILAVVAGAAFAFAYFGIK